MNRSALQIKYNDPGSGLFKDNTTKDISEQDLRDFVTDIANMAFTFDDNKYNGIKGTSPGINTITALKAIVTVNNGVTPVGTCIAYRDTSDNVFRFYELVSGTDAESLPSIVRPTDYNGTSNQKVWKSAPAGSTNLASVLAAGNNASGSSILELSQINNTSNDFELLAPTFNATLDEMHIFTESSPLDGSVIFEISVNPAGENSGFKIYDLFGSWSSVIESFQPSDNYKAEIASTGGVNAAARWTNITTSDYASFSAASNPNSVGEGIIYIEQLGAAHTLLQIGPSDNGINGFDLETNEMLIRCSSYIDISKIKCIADVAIDSNSFGIIQKSANGHYWRQTVSNVGVATWTDLGTSLP